MRDRKLIIADGHHRYETALTYRNDGAGRGPGRGHRRSLRFVMMTFVDMDYPGLVILPTHRVVLWAAIVGPLTFTMKSGNSST